MRSFSQISGLGPATRLKNAGTKILAELSEPWGKLVVLEDTEDNCLKLMQPGQEDTMYVPKLYSTQDRDLCGKIVSNHPLATVVTFNSGEPYANHLPLLWDRERNVLMGHMARANPQWKSMKDGQPVLCVFTGPNSYITPKWYPSLQQGENHVPTWNYAVVHITGRARIIDPRDSEEEVRQFHNLLSISVKAFETGMPDPWLMDLPEKFERKLMDAIVGFEIAVEKMEGKFKLSQNRSPIDRESVIQSVGGDVQELMKRWYDSNLNAESGIQK